MGGMCELLADENLKMQDNSSELKISAILQTWASM